MNEDGKTVRAPWPSRVALAFVLVTALAARVWLVLSHTYVVAPDETFQYLEQGHRLAFGSGVLPWEYADGIRSWLFPGMIAAVMRVVAFVDPSPDAYVFAVRLACIAASLVLPYVGFRLGERHGGLAGGLVVGLLGALWYDALYYAPVVMTEPIASYAGIAGLYLGEQPATRRRLATSGALLGLATCLRYQYGPELAIAALIQHWCNRSALIVVALAGIAVVALSSGLLDTLTWGTPFQSIWLNFQRNAIEKVSTSMGTEPWWFSAGYFFVAWNVAAPILLGLALLGAIRVPALGMAALMTIALHTIPAHKEVRFIFLAIAAAPLLVGVGLARLNILRGCRAVVAAVAAALVVSGVEAAVMLTTATPADAWHRDESVVQAFAVARSIPDLCGLGLSSMWVFRTGGYTYLHRNVPIYFDTFRSSQILPGTEFRASVQVMRHGRAVPQFADATLPEHESYYNVLIGNTDDQPRGFSTVACFGSGVPGDARLCVFRRPGGCD